MDKVKEKPSGLSVPAYDAVGKEAGSMDLPEEIFAQKVNKPLLAQALRVYLNNQKAHFSNTKTRGEVSGSTRKIYSQKGTGRARHGSIKAPIFVRGGLALGPKYRKVVLKLPPKMKDRALISALSVKMAEKEVFGLMDPDKLNGKTAQVKKMFDKIGKKNVLLVGGPADSLSRALKNIPAVRFISADQINPLSIITYQTLLVTKEAVQKLEDRLMGKKEQKND